ncbi:acetylcholinesterase [Nephila pilipes]|uniref:Carboxylic ester hydrolase n=1 Tax=Nephila pilipes TaxID=299642 RepID=A0A8X6QH08_NEPPI|nr:acetylcholinesterase [Nephila pilipes]
MTNNGPVQGITVASSEHEVEAFLGIPFAEPPIGDLRFRKPIPKTSWTDVYDASRKPPTCVQNVTERYYWSPNIENMTEDCLYLNLWVPYSGSERRLKPILIYIHGGGFNFGSANQKFFDGKNLAKFGDVIVGNMNYRVGVMGFFSAFIEEADGNMGMYDQLLAMKWISDNAKHFGGDPNHIVLMGESAGAMSVTLHLVSPLSKSIAIKRAILQSGSGVIPIISEESNQVHRYSKALALLLGCENKNFTIKNDPKIVVECLKRLPVEKLSFAEGRIKRMNPACFVPRVGDEFMPHSAAKDLKEGNFRDIELLTGVNKQEGPFFLTIAAPQFFGKYGEHMPSSVSRGSARMITQAFFKTLGQKNDKEILNTYINSIKNGTSDEYTYGISSAMGDFMISCSTLFQAEFHSMKSPAYFYVFSRRPSSTLLAAWMGTTHFEEVQYVFGNPIYEHFTPEEEQLSRRMMSRWVSFVKTGNPNVPGETEWPLFKHDDPAYLEINDEEKVVRLRPDNYRCDFWRERFHAQI